MLNAEMTKLKDFAERIAELMGRPHDDAMQDVTGSQGYRVVSRMWNSDTLCLTIGFTTEPGEKYFSLTVFEKLRLRSGLELRPLFILPTQTEFLDVDFVRAVACYSAWEKKFSNPPTH